MALYAYSVTSTASTLTGGGGQPPNRAGTLRAVVSINNPQATPVTVKLYDNTTTTLTTSVPAYTVDSQTPAVAYGAFARGVSGALDASGTPTLSAAATFTPPTAAPTGTGLPSDVAAEVQDYRSTMGVYSLLKYPGLTQSTATVAANPSLALKPIAQFIVPANTIEYAVAIPISYVSGLVAQSDNASAVSLVLDID